MSLNTIITEYGSTLYVGMALKKNGHPCISIASDELKSLVNIIEISIRHA